MGSYADAAQESAEKRRKAVETAIAVVSHVAPGHPFVDWLNRGTNRPASTAGTDEDAELLRRIEHAETQLDQMTRDVLEAQAELGVLQIEAKLKARIQQAIPQALTDHFAPPRRLFSWQTDALGHAPPHWW